MLLPQLPALGAPGLCVPGRPTFFPLFARARPLGNSAGEVWARPNAVRLLIFATRRWWIAPGTRVTPAVPNHLEPWLGVRALPPFY
jgi:hypothetical protein